MRKTKAELLALLDTIRRAVADGDSFTGRLSYEMLNLDGDYEVSADFDLATEGQLWPEQHIVILPAPAMASDCGTHSGKTEQSQPTAHCPIDNQ